MAIEEVAAEKPEAILRELVDPGWGLQAFQARRLAYGLGLTGLPQRGAATVIQKLAQLFQDLDSSLVEINPLIITADDQVVALDAKINIDDNVLFRRPDLVELRDLSEEDALEVEASEHNLSYIALDGTIAGGEPANFLDVGGSASAETVANAFRILMKAPNLEAVLINIFGGIVRGDRVAKGIIEALEQVEVNVPVVVRLQGTNAEEGRRLLQESSLEFTVAETLNEAASKAVEMSQ